MLSQKANIIKQVFPIWITCFFVSLVIQLSFFSRGSFASKFLLSDLIFLPAYFYLLINLKHVKKIASSIDLVFLLILIHQILAIFQINWQICLKEFLILVHLYSISIFIRFICFQNKHSSIKDLFSKFSTAGVFLSITILLSSILYAIYQLKQFGIEFKDYPYFKDVFRSMGTMQSPNRAAGFLFLSILAGISIKKNAFQLFASCFTYSKEVLLISSLFLIDRFKNKTKIALILFSIFSFTFILLTHISIVPNSEINKIKSQEYYSGEILFSTKEKSIVSTSYYSLKLLCLKMGVENPIFGVGSEQFHKNLEEEKTKRNYPKHLPNYHPHSFWFGVLAQQGIIGLILWILFFGMLIWMFLKMEKSKIKLTLLIGLLFIIIEGISVENQHYRYHWIWIGLIISHFEFGQKKS
jgi:hypothetical protein